MSLAMISSKKDCNSKTQAPNGSHLKNALKGIHRHRSCHRATTEKNQQKGSQDLTCSPPWNHHETYFEDPVVDLFSSAPSTNPAAYISNIKRI